MGFPLILPHICEESGVGAEIQAAAIPRATVGKQKREVDLQTALHGGEDYELLFTAPRGKQLPAKIAGVAVTKIGRITRVPQMILIDTAGATNPVQSARVGTSSAFEETTMKILLQLLKISGFCLLLITKASTAPHNGADVKAPLSLEGAITLPNVEGRIDHFSVDVDGQRVFVAAVENHTVEVADVKSGKVTNTIRDLPEPQGVLYERSSNRLFIACGQDGTVRIFDATSFRPIASVKFPEDADNLRYDATRKQIIVGYAGAKQLRKRNDGAGGLGFMDLDGKRLGDVVIDAHPESFQLNRAATRAFVNVPDKQEIEVVDLTRRAVVARWPVTSSRDNFPMALDEAHHRLMVGAWNPPRLLVFDMETGKQVASRRKSPARPTIFSTMPATGESTF